MSACPPTCRRTLPLLLAVALAATCLLSPRAAAAQTAQEAATGSALYMLQQSVSVRRDGQHHQLLRALRHLRDPALKPLYERLLNAPQPALQIHGILGLAELSADRRIALAHLAQIREPLVQAEVISAAMDSDLLHVEQIQELMGWADLDEGLALVLAGHLMEAGQFSNVQLLREAAGSERLARRSMAALLLHQLDDPTGLEHLLALNSSTAPQRDQVRDMLLVTAMRHEFHRAAGWAYAIATEPGVSSRLSLLALHTAMRFGLPQATQLWQERLAGTQDAAQRTRLALLGLQLAPWLEASVFATMAQHEDPLIRQMGQAGIAIAGGRQDIPEQAVALVRMHHTMSNAWALSYAREHASLTDGQLILLGLIDAYEQGPEQGRIQRLDDVVQATELLFEKDAAVAASLLRPILASPRTDPNLTEAILLGLMRSKEPGAHRVVVGLAEFGQRRNNHLALLLRARAEGEALTPVQMNDLALLVQGGGNLQSSLRIQATWAWLKRTNQAQTVLTRVLESF